MGQVQGEYARASSQHDADMTAHGGALDVHCNKSARIDSADGALLAFETVTYGVLGAFGPSVPASGFTSSGGFGGSNRFHLRGVSSSS